MKKFFSRYVVVVLCAVFCFSCSSDDEVYNVVSSNKYVLIDSNTGNDIDNYIAITALLKDNTSKLSLEGVNSSQFKKSNSSLSVSYSKQMNDSIIIFNNKNASVLSFKGSENEIDDLDDAITVEKSAAVIKIVEICDKLKVNEKLDIICLGAATNVASALIYRPDLASKMRIWMVACKTINVKTGAWNKNEDNVVNDFTAFDNLLNNTNINEIHIISKEVANKFVLNKSWFYDLYNKDTKTSLDAFLIKQWNSFNYNQKITTPGVALVESYLAYCYGNSSLFTEVPVAVSKENGNRKVNVITSFELDDMRTSLGDSYTNNNF